MSIKILIAEDDPHILKMIRIMLDKEGYTTETCTNGRDAVRIVGREPIDFIVCDQMMPHVTGSELAAFIRDNEKTRHIPIILLSAENNPKAFAELIDKKVINCFVPKPIQYKQLMNLISILLLQSKKLK